MHAKVDFRKVGHISPSQNDKAESPNHVSETWYFLFVATIAYLFKAIRLLLYKYVKILPMLDY